MNNDVLGGDMYAGRDTGAQLKSGARAPRAGFTNRAESEYDPFGAGHSSTSVSAALGMAVARDFKVRPCRKTSGAHARQPHICPLH